MSLDAAVDVVDAPVEPVDALVSLLLLSLPQPATTRAPDARAARPTNRQDLDLRITSPPTGRGPDQKTVRPAGPRVLLTNALANLTQSRRQCKPDFSRHTRGLTSTY